MSKYGNRPHLLLIDWLGLADLFGTPSQSGAWWYMCFAQVMVVLIPLFIEICRKFGWITIMLGFVATQYFTGGFVSPSGGDYIMYLSGTILGILFALNNAFSAVKKITKSWKKVLVFAALCIVTVGLIVLRFHLNSESFEYNQRHLTWFLYGISAALICAIAGLSNGKGLLTFLGRHSGTMFLTHMLFVYYIPAVVFYTKTVLGSFLTLVVLSLLSSYIIDKIIILIHYNDFMNKVYQKLAMKWQ